LIAKATLEMSTLKDEKITCKVALGLIAARKVTKMETSTTQSQKIINLNLLFGLNFLILGLGLP
jgi:hypothetical protein